MDIMPCGCEIWTRVPSGDEAVTHYIKFCVSHSRNFHLKAENTRLKAALEAAPDPDVYATQVGYAYCDWYTGPRAEALKGESHE